MDMLTTEFQLGKKKRGEGGVKRGRGLFKKLKNRN